MPYHAFKDAAMVHVGESCHSPVVRWPRLAVLVGGIGLEASFFTHGRRDREEVFKDCIIVTVVGRKGSNVVDRHPALAKVEDRRGAESATRGGAFFRAA